MIRTLFFDLDDTLYPSSSGLWDAIGDRITLYMVERLGLATDDAVALRSRYFEAHGTTLNGLVREYGVDPEDYNAFVHDLPLGNYLRPDPALAAMLAGLSQLKAVLTNADLDHALRVLGALGVREHFGLIVDIRALGWVNKPETGAYRRAMELARVSDPRECLIVEDSIRNLRAARELGMTAVYVGPHDPGDAADYVLRQVTDLVEAIPGLNHK